MRKRCPRKRKKWQGLWEGHVQCRKFTLVRTMSHSIISAPCFAPSMYEITVCSGYIPDEPRWPRIKGRPQGSPSGPTSSGSHDQRAQDVFWCDKPDLLRIRINLMIRQVKEINIVLIEKWNKTDLLVTAFIFDYVFN